MRRLPVDTKNLQDFSERVGLPVLVIAANWNGDRAVEFDDKAARVFYDVLEATLASVSEDASGEMPLEVALVLVGQGGQCQFADAVRRAFCGLKITYRAYIPCPVDGAMTLLSLGSSQIVVHPFGGVGALEQGSDHRAANSAVLLAARMLQRSGHTLDSKRLDPLQSANMGQGTFLGESDLVRLGIRARTAVGEERHALWSLFEAIEEAIGLTESRQERFTASEAWPDEVEFEPATMLAAAMIGSVHRQAVFELDTGRPDPDKARLQGVWRQIIP